MFQAGGAKEWSKQIKLTRPMAPNSRVVLLRLDGHAGQIGHEAVVDVVDVVVGLNCERCRYPRCTGQFKNSD